VSGRVVCPGCRGALGPWGRARPRGVFGLAGVLRPRRARCRGCLVTHVLLPVTVLLRRAYAVELIGAALVARAGGWGHRSIGRQLGVPVGTVRGWLRRMGARLGPVRTWLLGVARCAEVDQAVPKAQGVHVARCAGRGGGGEDGGDGGGSGRGGARPGDGVAGGRGVFDGSASVAGMATGVVGSREQHQLPLTLGRGWAKPSPGSVPDLDCGRVRDWNRGFGERI
jgi:hypothetical protein